MKSLGQSLAGRTGILKLLPFSFKERYSTEIPSVEDMLYQGFYPRIYDQQIQPGFFYSSYLMTYIERDIRLISQIQNLSLFQKFIELCAGRTGQVLNKNSLANECGISNKTVEEWLSLLETSFIIFRLRPYYKNWNKRIVKSPKLYFYDTGLVSYLLRIESPEQIIYHPLRGELFETYVVSEFLKKRFHVGARENIYYFRDNNKNEVDIIIDTASGPIPVEIKSGKTVHRQFFKGLDYFGGMSHSYKRSGLIIGRNIYEKRSSYLIAGHDNIYGLYHDLTNNNNLD